MTDTPHDIERQFNQHMFLAHEILGLDVHETSISVKYKDGFYNVRFRENYENRLKLEDAAKEFASRHTPPLSINFV